MTEVLVIQHQASEGAGTISEEIEASGLGIHLLRIDQGEPVPSSPGSWKAVVVMGGTMGVYDQGKLRHLQEEISLLRLFLRKIVLSWESVWGPSFWRRRSERR